MSNKTQLQTNNTNLDALILRVNAAKNTAASLPSAGGGGSGGIETCTVTAIHPGSLTPITPYIIYTNSNMEVVSEQFTDTLTLTVAKGTILLGLEGSGMDEVASGDATIILHYGPQTSFQINGDATIKLYPM